MLRGLSENSITCVEIDTNMMNIYVPKYFAFEDNGKATKHVNAKYSFENYFEDL